MPKLVHILEFIQATRSLEVDRANGIIKNVKICGCSSPNAHKVRDRDGRLVEGTDYTDEALAQEQRLVEGMNVNVNHPPENNPYQNRDAYDRFAWLQDTVHRPREGVFGNLHFLDPTDKLAVRMMNAAEKKPDAFALSHNASGIGEVRGRRWVVTRVPEVRSVDIVADGGACRSLVESREPKMSLKKWKDTFKVSSVLEALKKSSPKTPKRNNRVGSFLTRLLEGEYGAMEVDDIAPANDTATDAEPDNWEHHFGKMLGSIVNDAELSPQQKIAKITAAVKELLKEEEAEEEEPILEEEEDDEDDDEKDKAVKESKQLKRTNAALVVLMEAGIKGTVEQVEALAAMDNDDKRKKLAATFQVAKPGTIPKSPKSSTPSTHMVPITEGKAKTETPETNGKILPDADKIAARLRSWN